MKTFKIHLKEALKDEQFKDMFEEEKKLIELSLEIHKAREQSGLSQREVAKNAHITQQQLSKIENGINCNIVTFLKVCKTLGIDISLNSKKHRIII